MASTLPLKVRPRAYGTMRRAAARSRSAANEHVILTSAPIDEGCSHRVIGRRESRNATVGLWLADYAAAESAAAATALPESLESFTSLVLPPSNLPPPASLM